MAVIVEQLTGGASAMPLGAWRLAWYWWAVGGLGLLLVLLLGGFELAYANKVYPGVRADGVYLGGLSKAEATSQLAAKVVAFSSATLAINYGDTTLRLPVSGLQLKYDTARAIDLAYNYGRQGNMVTRLHAQLRALVGRATNFAAYSYSDANLVPYVDQVADDVVTSARDASLSFAGGRAQVTPAQAGQRLDIGQLTVAVADRLAQTSSADIAAPVYALAPVVSTAALSSATGEASAYVSAPITLTYSGTSQQVDPATIVTWLAVNHGTQHDFLVTHDLADLYPPAVATSLSLDQSAVAQYVASLASKLNQVPQNAGVSMQNSQLTVTQPSHDGTTLDQTAATRGIVAALAKQGADRTVALDITTVKADVNESDLASLGITDLLSEGETYFPGSPADRLINVAAGAKRFNNVLLKPGETFSFGALLGGVDASTGYVPELVIVGDHEEKQYGGGLCQVSTTAFRAALLAGLPITERVNHAFAISYYTWPYGVPGVDATIYYPQVDLKFVNDTGHYILIQTTMSGVDLKFDFYGTKTKTGVIRGPYFVSGSNNSAQASHTVFYRDVLDLAGKVTKTDTFNTYYQPSTNFPVETSGFN